MRCWEIGPRGGIQSLRQSERPDPAPRPGKALVQVTAAGLNYRDLMVLTGLYGSSLPDDRIPLSDGVETVVALGADANLLGLGQRVIAPLHRLARWAVFDGAVWPRSGCHH